jgi:hypothetical protein
MSRRATTEAVNIGAAGKIAVARFCSRKRTSPSHRRNIELTVITIATMAVPASTKKKKFGPLRARWRILSQSFAVMFRYGDREARDRAPDPRIIRSINSCGGALPVALQSASAFKGCG